jgi:type II secretory pathway predicted ATPase ExeA
MTSLESHFGLNKLPFPKIATDAALLQTPAISRAVTRLHFAQRRDTLALLLAESGCSKTTLMSLFARSLDAANTNVVSTALTTLKPFSFLAHLLAAMGLPGRRFKGETAAALLAHFRSQPKRTLVLIDEAHLLPDSSLEDLRLLTDSSLGNSPFGLVLAGQPILRDRLAEAHHEALWQRIGVRIRLSPLPEPDIRPFVEGHISAAGGKKTIFDDAALAQLFAGSRGVPRLIQNIAIEAMQIAMSQNKTIVDAEAVQLAIVDLEAA